MDAIGISFFIYTLAIMAFGVYTARFAKKSSQDFFLADRGLGSWVAALWIVPGTVLAFLFNWFVMANRLRSISREGGQITIPDMLVGRHAGGVAVAIRLLSIVVILAMLSIYVAAQINAAA